MSGKIENELLYRLLWKPSLLLREAVVVLLDPGVEAANGGAVQGGQGAVGEADM